MSYQQTKTYVIGDLTRVVVKPRAEYGGGGTL